MKKMLATITAATVLLATSSVFAERPIKVAVGGGLIESDVPAITVEDRTMLPARAVFEAIGAEVEYVDSEEKVIATKGDTVVEFTINSKIMKINGEEKTIDVPAMIQDDRTLIPVRACAEAFKLKVDWNDATHTVNVRIPVSIPVECSDGTVRKLDERGNIIYDEYVTDTGKVTVTYTYDENDFATYAEYGDGSWEKFTYDERGNHTRYDSADDWVVYTYDENDNLIAWENNSGFWARYAYDQNGNITYYETSEGHWEKNEYNELGDVVFYESSNGYWVKNTYDENGILTRQETDGYITDNTIDENGYTISVTTDYDGFWTKSIYQNDNILSYEDSSDTKASYLYDENGNPISCEKNDGTWWRYTYNDNHDVTRYENSDGYWEAYSYDENGRDSFYESSDGNWSKSEYDENGNLTYFENADGYWEKSEYDENGNLLYEETSDGYWEKYAVVVK